MASFTAAGDNVELLVPDKGEDVLVSLSGTYNMVIDLEKEVGAPGSNAWELVKSYSTANATVSESFPNDQFNTTWRLFVTTDTSGTCTATLTDNTDKTILDLKDQVGNQKVVVTQATFEHKNSVVGPAPVNTTAALTLTAAAHAGRVVTVNSAAGVAITLPAATGTGNVYRVFIGTTVTSSSCTIAVANATDEFRGTVYQIDADTADAIAAYPCLAADNFDTITMNGTTTGGIDGDFYILTDVASGVWMLEGTQTVTGTAATPLSAAV